MRRGQQHDATGVLCDTRERGRKRIGVSRPHEEDGVDIAKGVFDRLGRGEIAAHHRDVARQSGAVGIARQRADVRAGSEKLGDHFTSDGSSRSGDEDSLHRDSYAFASADPRICAAAHARDSTMPAMNRNRHNRNSRSASRVAAPSARCVMLAACGWTKKLIDRNPAWTIRVRSISLPPNIGAF